MTDLNPYEELGVERTADEPAIRKAYRGKAKTAHPDKGGNREQWERVSRSLTVLTNPKSREHYDRTGKIDEPEVDNDRAGALAIVHSHLGTLVTAFLNGGFKPEDDPRYIDIPGKIRAIIETEIAEGHQNIATGTEVVAYQRDLKRRFRFKGKRAQDDTISKIFEAQIADSEKAIANIREAIRLRKLALEVLRDYSFDRKDREWSFEDGLQYGAATRSTFVL